jgi:hypothetical protein
MNTNITIQNDAIKLPSSYFPEQNKSGLIEAIYYDSDWWKKNIATEWWRRNGHFNETLYKNLLNAKLDSIKRLENCLSNNSLN